MVEETVLVIGSEGFLGRHVVSNLLDRQTTHSNLKIRGLDLQTKSSWDSRIKFIPGDVSNLDDLRRACSGGVSTIFYLASPHYDASDKVLYKVNVLGVNNIINLCHELNIPNLIYTGSAIPFFYKESVRHIDESAVPTGFINEYARTKYLGEQLILKANCSTLKTCSLRLYSLIGPGDTQIAPALMEIHQMGLTDYCIGDNTNLVDFTAVQNAAHAHILAWDNLTKAQGQAYFITNGTPIPFFQLYRKFLSYIDPKNDTFTRHLPARLAHLLAIVATPIVQTIQPYIPFRWHFTPFAVLTGTSEVYFNISKAHRELGYKPMVSLDEAIRSSAKSYLARQ